jgi:hypothetical protein
MIAKLSTAAIILFAFSTKQEVTESWIRINQLGYQPNCMKVAVWCSKEQSTIGNWQLAISRS